MIISVFFGTDENRDINIHHIEHEEIKRQRIQYNGDQIYPNVSLGGQEIFEFKITVICPLDLVIEVVRERRAAAKATDDGLNRQSRHFDINTSAQQ